MALIGIEEHWTTPALTAALEGLPVGRKDPSLAFNRIRDHLERLQDLDVGRIAAMDEMSIDVMVLGVAPPATGPLDPADALALSRDTNDVAADAIRRHPDRLRAMATLPMADPDQVAGELERAVGLGLVGAMVYGRTGATPLDDQRYDDLFAIATSLQQPIFIHPQIPSPALLEASYAGFDDAVGLALSTFAWGWHLEAALATLRLIARGTFDRHPDLQIVLGHWGELLLFWQDRFGSLTGIAGLERPVADVVRQNLHITSSGMFNPALLHHALEATTIDRILFSTDYPFQHPSRADIEQFLKELPSDDDREQFASGNASRLYGIEVAST